MKEVTYMLVLSNSGARAVVVLWNLKLLFYAIYD